MRILVVYCHPDPESFCAAIRDVALAALRQAGHEIRLLDLYAANFDPVLSREERRGYYDETANQAGVHDSVEHLRWAEAVIFVYPTWWYGQPAMLKGWLDRVFLPGAAFALPRPGDAMIRPLLTNIRLVAAVSTLGSPRWYWWRIGRPGQRALLTGLALLGQRRCRTLWIALYDMDHAGPEQRSRFLRTVSRKLGRLGS